MNNRQKKTFVALWSHPVRSNIEWKDIELLFVALGAEITEGRGSRVRVALNERRAVFHRPHPESVTDKGAVRSVCEFLSNAGVMPPN